MLRVILRAVELAPEYADVTALRWRQLFPNQPVTLEDGRSYDDVAAERGKEISDAA